MRTETVICDRCHKACHNFSAFTVYHGSYEYCKLDVCGDCLTPDAEDRRMLSALGTGNVSAYRTRFFAPIIVGMQ